MSYLIIEKEDEITEFKFPQEAYAYKIELINSGLNFLLFHNIIINESENKHLNMITLQIKLK